MSKPATFSDLGKAVKDLIYPSGDEYNLKQPSVEVQTSHGSPSTQLTGKFDAHPDGKVSMELKDKILVKKNTWLTMKLPSSKPPSFELENKGSLVSGLNTTAKAQVGGAFSLNTKYFRDTVAATADIEVSDLQQNDVSIKPSLLLGPFVDSRVYLGASAVFKPSAKDVLAQYDAGVEYTSGALTTTAKVVDNGNALNVGVSLRASPKAFFATEYKYNLNSDKALTLAAKYNFTPETSLQSKVESNGQVSSILSQQVTPQVGLQVSSSFNATRLEKGSPDFGLKLTLAGL